MNYRNLAMKYLMLTFLTDGGATNMLDSTIKTYLEQRKIPITDENADLLLEVFRLGFESGWFLSLDEDITGHPRGN